MPNMLIGSAVRNINLSALERWADLGIMPWMADGDGNSMNAFQLYPAVAYLFRAINIRASSLCDVPWAIYDQSGAPVWSSEDNQPPPSLSGLAGFPRLLARAEVALCLGSRAYIHKERNRVRTTGLRWFDPQYVEPVWTAQGLVGFKRRVNTQEAFIPRDDVVYLRYEGWSETEPAPPPAMAALGASRAAYNVGEFVSAFFGRGAVKATVLQTENIVMAEEKSALKEWWRRAFSGVRNAFNTEIINGKITPVVVGEGIESLNNRELTDAQREEIATALGIPHSLIMSNAANFATAEADRLNFYDMTILPEARLLAVQFNEQLFAPMGLHLAFNPEEMGIYQENEAERATAVLAYVNAGTPLSVAMGILGVQLPEGVTLGSLDAARSETPQPEPESEPEDETLVEQRRFVRWAKRRRNPDPAAFKSDILSDADKVALLATIEEAATAQPPFGMTTRSAYSDRADRERRALERRHADALAVALTTWRKRALGGGASVTAQSFEQGLNDHRQVLSDALYALLLDGARLGVDVGQAQIDALTGSGKAVTVTASAWDLANAAVIAWLVGDGGAGALGAYLNTLTNQIMATTIAQAAPLVAAWAQNGQPLSALVDALAGAFGEARARRIATTEVTRAYARGNREAWRASGVVDGRRWSTSADEAVCPVCGGLNGQEQGIDAPFVWDGNEYDDPPAHPGCRCTLLPVVD